MSDAPLGKAEPICDTGSASVKNEWKTLHSSQEKGGIKKKIEKPPGRHPGQ